MEYLSREQVLGLADDLRTDTAELPNGKTVLVRELTGDEYENLGFGMMDAAGKIDARKAKGQNTNMILWATLNNDKTRMFTKNDEVQVKRLPHTVRAAIAGKILELSGLSREHAPRLWTVECPHCSGPVEVDLTALAEDYESAQVQEDESKN
jgi:hypothetical protein